MTDKEKAKAYDEALALAKRLISNNCTEVEKLCLKCVFPELKESEDERIRESLIEFLTEIKDISESGRTSWAVRKEDAEMCKSFIDYLEKQKEQSITANDLDEEIHRFFDDCIEVHDAKIYGVDERVITVDCYEITARHFAKWGEKQKEQKSAECEWPNLSNCIKNCKKCQGKCFYRKESYEAVERINLGNEFENQVSRILASVLNGEHEYNEGFVKYAAQSLLGYAKNEIKSSESDKIERLMKALQATNAQIGELVEENYKLKEQKPAEWSDEDEQRITEIEFAVMQMNTKRVDTKDKCLAWLKSLRPQQKVEWSDEDADMLNCCISSIEEAKENRYAYKETDGDTSYDREIDWLKSLNLQPKQEWSGVTINGEPVSIENKSVDVPLTEWSEEDEENINTLIEVVHERMGLSEKRKQYYEKWLKSLRYKPHTVSTKDATKFGNLEYERGVKDGIQSEKSHQWKPTEKQIYSLGTVVKGMGNISVGSVEYNLKALYEQLKKLM